MTQLNEAKEVLEDPEARREYDATLPSVHEPTVAGGLAGEPSMPSQPAYVYVPGLRGRLNALLAGLDAIADWLGPMPGDADALFRATVTRSTAEPEQISAGQGIGYFALVWSKGGGLFRSGSGIRLDP